MVAGYRGIPGCRSYIRATVVSGVLCWNPLTLCCINHFDMRNHSYCFWMLYLIYQLKLRIYCFMWQIPIAETSSCKKKGTYYVLEWKHLKQPYTSVCAQTISHLSDFIALDWVKSGEFICFNHDSLCDLIEWCRYVIVTALTVFCI